jgi:hypothetical protein
MESESLVWTTRIAWGALAWLIYFGGIGWYVAEMRRRPLWEGIILGLLAGPFGWLIVACLPEGKG